MPDEVFGHGDKTRADEIPNMFPRGMETIAAVIGREAVIATVVSCLKRELDHNGLDASDCFVVGLIQLV